MVTMLCAMQLSNRGIGKENKLLYKISEDLKRFKQLTMQSPNMIMGRKTFRSFEGRLLPGRKHIVLSKNESDFPLEVAHLQSIEEAIGLISTTDNCSIIGGESLYRDLMPYTDIIELTVISSDTERPADAFFPEIDPVMFELTKETNPMWSDSEKCFYHYETYTRKK